MAFAVNACCTVVFRWYNNRKRVAGIVVKEKCSAEMEVKNNAIQRLREGKDFDIEARLVSLVTVFHPLHFFYLILFLFFCSLSSALSLQAVILSTSG